MRPVRTSFRRSRRSPRLGAGALLGISIIGVVVLSIMLLGQGFLSGAVSITDATLAGRQAEYLADAAVNEAYYLLQTGRNDAFLGLFMGGGGTSIAPARTQAAAPPGVTVADVEVVVEAANDFHGDGRGFYGTVALVAKVSVPRRVARVLGTSAYRTARHAYEYKAVQQGPPAEFADKMLYARKLDKLPDVERWYKEAVQDRWEAARVDAERRLQALVQDLVDRLTHHSGFAGDVHTLLDYTWNWPTNLSAIGSSNPWFHNFTPDTELDPNGGWGGVCDALGTLKLIDINIYAQQVGDVRWKCAWAGPDRDGWINGHPGVPAAGTILRKVVEDELNSRIALVWPEAGDTPGALARLQTIMNADTGPLTAAVASPVLKQRAADGDPAAGNWPKFREDGITGGALANQPAHVKGSHGTITSDELLLHPPNKPSPFPADPLTDLGNWRSYDNEKWYQLALAAYAPILAAIERFVQEWEKFLEDWNGVTYLRKWQEELQRLESKISFGSAPDETPIGRAYWDRMAAYRFPSIAEGIDYIAEKGGRAQAVYSFEAGGGLDVSMAGDATFVAAGDGVSFSVSGNGAGAKNIAARTLQVGGSVRAALFSPENPVRFGGGSVTGLVATDGLFNDGSNQLDAFTITHDAFDGAAVTVSISEYPAQVTIDRGDS